MNKIRQATTNKIIFLLRKVFYNTPIMRWRLTGYIYDKVFSFGMPDLSKPVNFRGAKFLVDANDRSYVPSMVGGYYEKLELDIFTDIATRAKVLLDIGANIGMYTILATKYNKDIKCHAFEPVLENIRLLEKNIKLNKSNEQATVVKAAVSDKNGTATIHLSDRLSGTHSLSVDRGGSTRKVQTLSVDSYCRAHKLTPDLIKIDVEGHEASVFQGMTQCLRSKPTIFMEYIPELNKGMEGLITDFEKIYKYCFVVDTVHGRTEKIPLSTINRDKMYNIILTNSKTHINLIKPYLTSVRTS